MALAGPVVLRGIVTNHCTFKMRLGAAPVTTYVTLPVVPVAMSSHQGNSLGIFVVLVMELVNCEEAAGLPSLMNPSGDAEN